VGRGAVTEQPPLGPTPFAQLVSSCLKKKAARRLQSIGDARVTLEDYQAQPESFSTVAAVPPPAPASRTRLPGALPWIVAALVLALVLGGIFLARRNGPVPLVKASLPAPADTSFSLSPESPGPVAVSPDGRRLAFSAADGDGKTRLFVRNLDAGTARALSGTEGAGYPFWSPDSLAARETVRHEHGRTGIERRLGSPATTSLLYDSPPDSRLRSTRFRARHGIVYRRGA
jgi:hypothetical protein